ncbi:unnamed protein product [Ceratitis capitata]|uniref:(Mediterranean fruit fly) hypothetical protein n=1 Tax=Ceratitis capitata TaxID=7213 RepID=A0A811V210_CERCA|nr:unnamed protein product [Ceratitis capitata]
MPKDKTDADASHDMRFRLTGRRRPARTRYDFGVIQSARCTQGLAMWPKTKIKTTKSTAAIRNGTRRLQT